MSSWDDDYVPTKAEWEREQFRGGYYRVGPGTNLDGPVTLLQHETERKCRETYVSILELFR